VTKDAAQRRYRTFYGTVNFGINAVSLPCRKSRLFLLGWAGIKGFEFDALKYEDKKWKVR
jgi:hypothetical protein